MITPRFNVTQDTNTVTVVIRAPYCNLQELDVSVEEEVFIFFCQPYYLRLHLPGKIQENEGTKSCFNADTGEFTFQYEKMHAGEYFSDLEFITRLLQPKVAVEEGNHQIEILNSQSTQILDVTTHSADNGVLYGFAMRGGYNFKPLNTEFQDIFDINPHEVKFENRHQYRQQMENKQFDAEHYLADLIESEQIEELLQLQAPWETLAKAEVTFTSKELDFLKDLPNISYNLNAAQIKYCVSTLIEILYAYCYDCRTTCFEKTCESGWTISKISASLCCFDSFEHPKEALICAFRRSLIYPLYRQFNLCQKTFGDLKTLLKLGEQFIIKCLIDIYNIFLTGDSGRYVLNNLFIKDYIIYLMQWDKDLWCNTVQELNTVVINKKELGLNLLQIEKSVASENKLITAMADLQITEKSDVDSDDVSSSDSETESSEGSNTSSESVPDSAE